MTEAWKGNIKMDTLMTRKEVADYLHVCQKTADRYINEKNFDGIIRIGRRVLISKNKLDDYISSKLERKYI